MEHNLTCCQSRRRTERAQPIERDLLHNVLSHAYSRLRQFGRALISDRLPDLRRNRNAATLRMVPTRRKMTER